MYEKRLKQLQSYSSFLPVRSLARTSNVSVLRVRLCQAPRLILLQVHWQLGAAHSQEQETPARPLDPISKTMLLPAYLRFILPYLHPTTPISYLISLFQPSPGYYFEGRGQLPLKVTDTSHRHPFLSYWGTLPSLRWGRHPRREKRGLRLCPLPPPPASFQCFFFNWVTCGWGPWGSII